MYVFAKLWKYTACSVFSELQCLTGLSCRLNGVFRFKTIFPVFPIVWLYKGKIVGRKAQVKISEWDMQKR